MREGTYPPRRVPEHCTQPQSWELSAGMWLWVRLLWVLSLSWAGTVSGTLCSLAIISG